MQQWNLGFEHELRKNMLLSIAYVGSKGTHLTPQYDLNQLTPIPSGQNPYVVNKLGAITSNDCDSIQTNTDSADPNFGQPVSASIQSTLGTAPLWVTDTHILP